MAASPSGWNLAPWTCSARTWLFLGQFRGIRNVVVCDVDRSRDRRLGGARMAGRRSRSSRGQWIYAPRLSQEMTMTMFICYGSTVQGGC